MERRISRIFIVVILAWIASLALGTMQVSARASWVNDAVRLSAQETGTNASLISFERKRIVDNIFKYTWILKVGPGEFDKIGIHRVIKERLPWVPIKAPKAVMMIHGDVTNFDYNFLQSTMSNKIPIYQSLGMFLAGNDIDVWGVDRRWTFVPDFKPGCTPIPGCDPYAQCIPFCNTPDDCTFMKDWDTPLHVKDIKIAVKVARTVRGLTGSGFDKIFMLGHSRGAVFTYAYANNETQVPAFLRDLKGIIPVDMVFKFDPDPNNKDAAQSIANACIRYDSYKTCMFNNGIFFDSAPLTFRKITILAQNCPDDPSEFFPGLTNKETFLLLLSAQYQTEFYPDPANCQDLLHLPSVPFYHALAGTFDPVTGKPTGLQFADPDVLLDLFAYRHGFQSNGEIIDGEALWCNQIDVPFDDHLKQITIPVLYVGGGGGFGELGTYTLSLLGSTDKESLVIHTNEAIRALDYGHADPVWANNAKDLIWQPIHDWIIRH